MEHHTHDGHFYSNKEPQLSTVTKDKLQDSEKFLLDFVCEGRTKRPIKVKRLLYGYRLTFPKDSKIRNDQQKAHEGKENNMIPIGSGHTLVHRKVYESIKWSSYTKATRKLLTALFPRKVLATHSLTGKASPAFPDKQAKFCLDARKVLDIVDEVVDKCRVSETLARGAITSKLADESKMMRMKRRANVRTTFVKPVVEL